MLALTCGVFYFGVMMDRDIYRTHFMNNDKYRTAHEI